VLYSTGLDWIGLDQISLDWNRSTWIGLDWFVFYCAELYCTQQVFHWFNTLRLNLLTFDTAKKSSNGEFRVDWLLSFNQKSFCRVCVQYS
jgi:hypothetical protein